MDLDKEFVRSIIRDGNSAFKLALERGVTEEHLYDEGKQVWQFLLEHYRKYGQIPSLELVTGSVASQRGGNVNLDASLADLFEPILDKILERRVLTVIIDGMKSVNEKVTQRNAKEASEVFNEIHRKLLKENLTEARVQSLFSLGKDVLAYYELVKSGGRGIPTPWASMDKQTMGWWPEDLVLLVGKRGLGKSWSMLLLAHSAWAPGHKVLICTTEMPRETLAGRFLCMHLRIPYPSYRDGRLGDFIENKFKEGIIALMEDEGIDMVGKGFDFSIDNLEAAVEESKADMLMVDGAYLIRNTGKDRHAQVSNTFNDFKRIGIKKHIPIVATTQFNRNAKSGQEETMTGDNIAITDVAIWNATAAFGLTQTEDMYKNYIMGWKSLKIREGRPQDWQSKWNLATMEFGEIIDGGGNPIALQPSNTIHSPFAPATEDEDMPDIPF